MPRDGDAINIVVVGDADVGKTSLISSLVSESFTERIPRVLQPVIVPPELTLDATPLAIVDTSSDPAQHSTLLQHLSRADCIVLVAATVPQSSLDRVESYWLPLFAQHHINVPIVLAINKTNTGHAQKGVATRWKHLVDSMKLESIIECSARQVLYVSDVFYHAQRAVQAPIQPLYDVQNKALRPLLIRALNRIFRMFDQDQDDEWNESELNHYQQFCYGRKLKPGAAQLIKSQLKKNSPTDLSSTSNITLSGFFTIIILMIQRHRADSVWRMLRRCGYDGELKLRKEYGMLPPLESDHTIELTPHGLQFLTSIFHRYDRDHDGGLSRVRVDGASELEMAFAGSSDDSPFASNHGRFVSTNAAGHVDLHGWLAHFSMLGLFHPTTLVRCLLYLAYPIWDGPTAVLKTININPRLSSERGHATTKRNTVYCLVMGANGVGKTSFCHCLINKPSTYHATSSSTAPRTYAALVTPNLPTMLTQPPVVPQTSTVSSSSPSPLSSSSSSSTSSSISSSTSTIPSLSIPSDLSASTPALPRSTSHSHSSSVNMSSSVPDLSARDEHQSHQRCAIHMSEPETPSFLVMREIPAKHAISTLRSAHDMDPCSLIVLIYDATKPASFTFVHDLLKRIPSHLPVVLVQTKCDRPEALETAHYTALSEYDVPIIPFSAALYPELPRSSPSTSPPSSSLIPSFFYHHIYQAARQPGSHLVVTLSARQRARLYRVVAVTTAVLGISVTGALVLPKWWRKWSQRASVL